MYLCRVSVVNAIEAVSYDSSPEESVAILSEVSLSAKLLVPNWVPIPVQLLESRGSSAFQALLDQDVNRLVEKFKNEYLEWRQQ